MKSPNSARAQADLSGGPILASATIGASLDQV